MARFQNVSPLGALEIPVLGRVVEAGEEFEVDAEDAPYFERQTENYRRVDEGGEPAADPVAGDVTEDGGEDVAA